MRIVELNAALFLFVFKSEKGYRMFRCRLWFLDIWVPSVGCLRKGVELKAAHLWSRKWSKRVGSLLGGFLPVDESMVLWPHSRWGLLKDNGCGFPGEIRIRVSCLIFNPSCGDSTMDEFGVERRPVSLLSDKGWVFRG